MVCQRNLVFDADDAERSSIFSSAEFVERELRAQLAGRAGATCRCESTWPGTSIGPTRAGPSAGQNFLYDPARGEPRPLTDDQLFRHLAVSHRICRIYAHDDQHAPQLAAALDSLDRARRQRRSDEHVMTKYRHARPRHVTPACRFTLPGRKA